MYQKNITIVGVGQVGCQIAMLLQQTPWANVTLTDINLNLAKGRALDIAQAGSINHTNANIKIKERSEAIVGADIIIITAGTPRKTGMSREELLKMNAQTVEDIGREIKANNADAFVILVTNPVDILTWVLIQRCGLNPKKTIGLSGVLDGGRFSYFLSQILDLYPAQIHPIVIGSHGDTMLILPRYTTVAGINLLELQKLGLITHEAIDSCVTQAKNGGGDIIKLLEHSSTAYGPAAAVVEMVQSIALHQKKILCCSVLLEDKYNSNNLCLGVPVILASQGIEQIIELSLDPSEQQLWEACTQVAQQNIAILS